MLTVDSDRLPQDLIQNNPTNSLHLTGLCRLLPMKNEVFAGASEQPRQIPEQRDNRQQGSGGLGQHGHHSCASRRGGSVASPRYQGHHDQITTQPPESGSRDKGA